jgi:predicted flavoprotein YhiN
MNERIQELAEQAGISYLSSVHPDMWEKFAQLIVRECDMVLSEDDGATHHSELLFTYFGVEE